jgi:hypothetical protein
MGLRGLLFGNRREYNMRVDALVKHELNIETDHSVNQNFPGSFVYLQELYI